MSAASTGLVLVSQASLPTWSEVLPTSPIPVALAALLLGLTSSRLLRDETRSGGTPARTVAANAVPAAATVLITVVVWTTPREVWLWGVVAVLGAAASLAPLVDGYGVAWRPPTPEEAARLAKSPAVDTADVRVVVGKDRIDGYAVGTPLGGAVGVSEGALATLSTAELGALLAHERAHHEGHHVAIRAATSAGWLAVGGVTIAGTVLGSVLLWPAVLGLLAGERAVATLVTRHTEYAADARAARRTSRAAVASLLETLSAVEADDQSDRRWRLLSSHPSSRRRIERLSE